MSGRRNKKDLNFSGKLPVSDASRPLKILVVANADSPLLRDRAMIPVAGGEEVVWFSESVQAPEAPCKVVHAPKYRFLGGFSRLLTAFRFWLTYLIVRPDVLHVHWAVFPPLLILPRWKRLVVSVMGSDIFRPGFQALNLKVSRQVLKRAEFVTSKSPYMDRRLMALGVPAEKIVRITWGVADELFNIRKEKDRLRQTMGIAADEVVFFSLRAIKPLYRVEQILQAFIRYVEEGGRGILIVSEMFGTSESRQQLRGLVEGTPARDRVRFAGAIPAEEMKYYYAISDAVISYADSDGMPQSLYEAMAAGCFPIFSDLPNYATLLQHGKNGYLCDTTDWSSLVRGMRDFSENFISDWNPDLNREQIVRLASRKSESEKLLALYRRMVS